MKKFITITLILASLDLYKFIKKNRIYIRIGIKKHIIIINKLKLMYLSIIKGKNIIFESE
ncbi:unnamed protein product [marine sediment metagenome]|uniref:Uncharacterized protein n=1 Tax=marine sediment metagenome TaxID=412755 RepID=X1BGK8_9ZZZZ